ncbi:MAG: diaminopimelate decarboxylase [Alphaproteobacteria bacterium]|nr:diaminopimelate decarboxylase [Alphaproteobacteria bacterium]
MNDVFHYENGALSVEQVALATIADAVGTPAYVYSSAGMRTQLRALQDAFSGQRMTVCYAIKANSNIAVIRTLANEGAGAEIVSGGELQKALKAGVPADMIMFAGVAKSRDEMALALDAGIAQFNVESVPELIALSEVAAAKKAEAPVAVRINPDVAADTHEKISTGRREDKFGISYERAGEVYAMAASLAGIEPVGVHLHIGSQIMSLAPFEAAYQRGADLVRELRAQGIAIRRLDLGGGMGVPYRGDARLDVAAYADLVREITAGLDIELLLEPGRYLVAEAGAMLARVCYIKQGHERPFAILDAGMNDLIRPALYDAYHEILPLKEPTPDTELQPTDVVGPICESSDIFARGRALPPLAAEDLVAFLGAGAYGAVMASDYNARPLAAEVLVDGDRFSVVRPRIEPVARFADECLPDWLEMPSFECGRAC